MNLVSNIPGVAADHIDPNLINPWGIVATSTSPFWVSDNGAGLSTLYNGGNPAVAGGDHPRSQGEPRRVHRRPQPASSPIPGRPS